MEAISGTGLESKVPVVDEGHKLREESSKSLESIGINKVANVNK